MRKLLLLTLLALLIPSVGRANIFTNTFGGTPTAPSQVAYASYTFGSNLTLFWPQFANGQTNVTATFMNMSATASGLNVFMPDATLSSVGYATIIYNTGSNTINIVNFSGGAIATIAPAATYYIVESGNGTQAGSWQAFQFGAGTSSASASALQGAGLLAIGGLLNVNYPGNVVNSNFSITSSGRAVPYIWTGGTGTITLPTAASVGSGFFFMLNNQGSGSIAVAASGSDTIDGSATSAFSQTQSAFIISTGSAWYTLGKGIQNTFAVTLLNLNVSGSSNITETSAQAQNIIQQYTGVLTGNINVVVPATVQLYYASNQTSGPYTLTLKTASGTGILVPQNQNIILYCDGTNVVNAYTAAVSGSLSLLNGTSTSPSLSFQSSPSTGMYASAAGLIDFAVSGIGKALEISTTGVNITNGSLAIGGAPTLTSGKLSLTTTSAIPLNGAYLSSVNALSLSTSGVPALMIGADQGVTFGTPTGGDKGAGTLNVAGNLYVNNSPVLTSVSPPTVTLVGDVTGSSTSPITTTVAKIQGAIVSGTTGTNNVVFSASPTLVTPNIGAATGTSLNFTATSAASGGFNGVLSNAVNTVALVTNGSVGLKQFSDQGMTIGSPSGGDLGASALNVAGVFQALSVSTTTLTVNGNAAMAGTTTTASLSVTGNTVLGGTTTANNLSITGTCVGCKGMIVGTPLTINPYSATATSGAHGLGVIPAIYDMRLVNLTPELGYNVGDSLVVGGSNLNGSANAAFSVSADSTNTYFSGAAAPSVTNKSSSSSSAITPADWELIITPYKIGN